ncbi:MAG: hypothetical protein U0R69_13565 [Gaiellales bacterium]
MRRLLALATALGALAVSAPAAQGMALGPPGGVDALVARCPTAAEVAAIAADLSLSFEHDPTAPDLVCTRAAGSADLTELGKRVHQALIAMEEMPFARPLPWTALTPYRWLVGAIDGIRFRDLAVGVGSCCDPAGVISVDPGDSLGSGAWMDPQSGAGLGGLPHIFAHEARHAETGPHTCGIVDQTIAELGANGVTYYLTLWEALYTGSYLDSAIGSGEYTREMTLSWAETHAEIYCNIPSTDLELTGNAPVEVAAGSPIDWSLVARNAGPVAAPETYLYVDVPTGARLVSATPAAGSCIATPVDEPVVVGCAFGSLPPLASVAVEIRLQPTIPAGLVRGGFFFAARVTGPVREPLATNNAVELRVSVTAAARACPGTPTSGGRVIRGTAGNDVLAGTRGGDVICGFGGTDVIRGRGGNDLLSGGSGKDRLIGGAGRDRCLPGAPGFRRGDTATGCERTR